MAMKQKNLPAVVEVEGVHGYIDGKGVAWLNVEDVARGLGFVDHQEKFSATSGRKTYEVIRWARVNGYLAEYDYPPVKAGDFIPENIFYLLAMKANNAVAKAFQLKIANEILPSIRKTGFYGVQKVPSEMETLEKIFGRETSNFLKARELKEMAAVTKNQLLREGLIRIAASMITDENFIICWRDDL